jgi:hypothetical protein
MRSSCYQVKPLRSRGAAYVKCSGACRGEHVVHCYRARTIGFCTGKRLRLAVLRPGLS